jgi:hypothetical protein
MWVDPMVIHGKMTEEDGYAIKAAVAMLTRVGIRPIQIIDHLRALAPEHIPEFYEKECVRIIVLIKGN